MQDALEIIDKHDPFFFHHDLITPHLLRYNHDKPRTLKLVGSVVIPRVHVVRIQLDKKFQRLYDLETLPKSEKKTEFAEENKEKS